MRRRVASTVLTVLVAFGVAPSLEANGAGGRAEPRGYVPPAHIAMHGSYDEISWAIASFDCSGAPDSGTELAHEFLPEAPAGVGVLSVRAPDSVGGLLRKGRQNVLGSASVRAMTGAAPQVVWRVELERATLTSDPVPIDADAWTTVWLKDAVFRDGEWSGSLSEWKDEFRGGQLLQAGLLSGGCLDSAEIQLDAMTQGEDTLNFEPSRWVDLDVWPKRPTLGGRITLKAWVARQRLGAFEPDPIRGARVDIERRVGKGGAWQVIGSGRADDSGRFDLRTTADARSYYRAVWRDRAGTILGFDPVRVDIDD